MNSVFSSFYVKISAVFLVILLGSGIAIGILCFRGFVDLVDEADQSLNQSLATELAQEFSPHLVDTIDDQKIQEIISHLMGINRRIEIYLLGGNGMIKAKYLPAEREVVHTVVDPGPLDEFMSQSGFRLIRNIDPLHATDKKPFSVAPIAIMGEEGCYLYIILGGEKYQTAFTMLQGSYIGRSLAIGLLLSLLLSSIVGLFLFRQVTKRFRSISQGVAAFERGEFQRRINVSGKDEIGELAHSVNNMAGTITKQVDELKRVDLLRRELIANVSHDLRSPLASIQGYLETVLLKGEGLNDEDRTEYIGTALRNSERLNTLVSELFELSKLDARQIEPEIESFSLSELVQDLVLQFKPQAEEKGVELLPVLKDGLYMVNADISLVERAISNLVGNAITHTPAGGQVQVYPDQKGPGVEISVIDNGAGISTEDLPFIFDRFYRADKSRSSTKSGGAGLGLAIAKKIVELHGSKLEVESTLNAGTRFSFFLPAPVSFA